MLTPLINRLNMTGEKQYKGPCPAIETIQSIKCLAEKAKKCNFFTKPLDQLYYTVLDTETTGFSPQEGDEIISIGAVKMKGNRLLPGENFHRLVNPYRPIPDKIVKLTGINDRMVENERDVFSVLKDLLDFLGDSVIVGHALKLDLSFINRKLKVYCNSRIYNIIIDTKNIATVIYAPKNKTDLDSLLGMHGIEPEGRHSALGDALLTARLFGIFLEMLRGKNILTIKELYDFLCHGDSCTVNGVNRVFFHW